MQMIAAKELEHPWPSDSLPLAGPAENPVEDMKNEETESSEGGKRLP